MFIYENMFSMRLQIGMARCLKYLALFNQNRMEALLGWFHTIGEQCKYIIYINMIYQLKKI